MDYPVPSMHLTIVGQQVKVLPVSLLVCSTQGCVSCPLASQEGYTAVPCLVTRRLHPSSLGLAAQVLALCSRLLTSSLLGVQKAGGGALPESSAWTLCPFPEGKSVSGTSVSPHSPSQTPRDSFLIQGGPASGLTFGPVPFFYLTNVWAPNLRGA